VSDQSPVTNQVKTIYETTGWAMVGDVTYDAQAFEDLRGAAQSYVSKCRLRVLKHLPKRGHRLLDMASGPVQYTEYLKYSEGFDTRVCVDLSQRALDAAKLKLGAHGEYHVGDFLDLSIEQVDAAISLHTIYHIHKSRQEAAVRKLVSVTKPGGKIVIVYSNPAYFISALLSPLRKIVRLLRPRQNEGETLDAIYFHRYPRIWWKRFTDLGTVQIHPWRTFGTREQRTFFPDNRLGVAMFSGLFALEDRYPRFFSAVGLYPMIVITKKIEAHH
jgi:SAM-dependent methyltransferase